MLNMNDLLYGVDSRKEPAYTSPTRDIHENMENHKSFLNQSASEMPFIVDDGHMTKMLSNKNILSPQYSNQQCQSPEQTSNPCNANNSNNNGSLQRRKNASRETTCMLKAWLNEHRRNPYPSKGEKVMLAIITKMTLTQVSTWFANARRRLKKENKMTWIPRHRSSDDQADDASDSDDLSVSEMDRDDDLTVFDEPGQLPPSTATIKTATPGNSSTSELFMRELSRLEEMASVKSENNEVSSNSSSSPRPLSSNYREDVIADDALAYIRNTLLSITRIISNIQHNNNNVRYETNFTALANTAILLAKSISAGKGQFVQIPPPILDHETCPVNLHNNSLPPFMRPNF